MKLMLSNKVYDVLKWIVLVVMPAISVLLVALTKAWKWDIPIDAIVVTFASIETFLGSLIGISTNTYNKESEKK